MPRRHPRLPLSNLGDLSRLEPGFTQRIVTPREHFFSRGSAAEATAENDHRNRDRVERSEAARTFFEQVAPTHVGVVRVEPAPGVLAAPEAVTSRLGSCDRSFRFFRDVAAAEAPCVRVQWRGSRNDVSYEVQRKVIADGGLRPAFEPVHWRGGPMTLDVWLPSAEGLHRIEYRVRATDGRAFSPWTDHTFHKPSWHNARRYHRLVLRKVIGGEQIARGRSFTPLTCPYEPPAEQPGDGFRRLIASRDPQGLRAKLDTLVMAAA